ncbi:glycoside hydrolase family 130 protein [Candidatus Pacearchaeota archaeon]|nr:glycoside hydrolase family 130 protein [Candidatus Pacearchaeota archaeon]
MAGHNNGMLGRPTGRDIVHRWEGNPLIDISDLSFKCSDILNAGVVEFGGGVLLLVTVEHLSGRRCVHIGRPVEHNRYVVDEEPFIRPSEDPKYKQHELQGVLDGRVTFLEGVYYITYIAMGDHGYRLGLATTEDFRSVKRLGLMSEPDTKTGVLFPARVKGRYARLDRPRDGHSIWVSYSDDLIHWGGSELVLSPRGGYWDSNRIGIGSVPVEIKQGWLLLYYGAKDTSSGSIYRIGAVILDRDEPTQVIGRAAIPILSPRENYERVGDIPNIVFCTGIVADKDGRIKMFYGAANSCICIGTTSVEEIVGNCIASEREY